MEGIYPLAFYGVWTEVEFQVNNRIRWILEEGSRSIAV